MLLALLGSFVLHAVLISHWHPTLNEPITPQGSETRTLRFEVITAAASSEQSVAPGFRTQQQLSPRPKASSLPTALQPEPLAGKMSPKNAVDPTPAQKRHKRPQRKPVIAQARPDQSTHQAWKQNPLSGATGGTGIERHAIQTETGQQPVGGRYRVEPHVQKQSGSQGRVRPTPKTPIISDLSSADTAQGFTAKKASRPDTVRRVTRLLEEQLRRHFRYPGLARRRGLEGTVLLQFTLQGDGRISNIQVLHSSGYGILDRNAQATLQRIGRVQLGRPLSPHQRLELTLPVTYQLNKG